MFAVIYQFTVKPKHEKLFIQAWKEMTELIYKHEGSLGSRLHKAAENSYIAYAQWPNQETFDGAGKNLPVHSAEIRNRMSEACYKVQTLHKLSIVEDLLQNEPKLEE